MNEKIRRKNENPKRKAMKSEIKRNIGIYNYMFRRKLCLV